jgi:hypothetical protein
VQLSLDSLDTVQDTKRFGEFDTRTFPEESLLAKLSVLKPVLKVRKGTKQQILKKLKPKTQIQAKPFQ